jgi:flavin-dependent dehydrogenase
MPSPRAETSASFDVAVVGGGPAGAATALALRRLDAGVRVALLERSDYAAFRAGETLPPPAQRLLTELGVWRNFAACGAVACYGTRAAWGGPDPQENAFIFSLYGRGWHLDRRRFDAWLAGEAANAGVEVLRRVRGLPAARRDGEWRLMAIDDEGAVHELRARLIVDATGRHSRIARSSGARHLAFDGLTGVAVRLRVAAGRADTYTEVEACRDGWWYTAALPGGQLLAMFMTDADYLRHLPWQTIEDWQALSSGAPRTAARIAGAVATGTPIVCPAMSQRLDTCAGDGWIAVGDAACTVDPLSSQGVMRALRSGIVAARAIHVHAAGDAQAVEELRARHVREYDAYLDTRDAYYRVEQRWPDSPFWRRRHTPVTDRGAAHAVRLENQHHEEPQSRAAGDLLVRGDAAGADRRRDLLEQPGRGRALAGLEGERHGLHAEPDRRALDVTGVRAGDEGHHHLRLHAPRG